MPRADASVFQVESSFDHGKHRNASGGTERAEKISSTHLSRKSPQSKYQYMEDGRMSARCPKVSFVLTSVPRTRVSVYSVVRDPIFGSRALVKDGEMRIGVDFNFTFP